MAISHEHFNLSAVLLKGYLLEQMGEGGGLKTKDDLGKMKY